MTVLSSPNLPPLSSSLFQTRTGALATAAELMHSSGVRDTPKALEGAARAQTGGLDWVSLRTRYVNAAVADRSGGDRTTAVRHWLRFCCLGRRISPVRNCDPDSPLTAKLIEEALLMDFALWLVLCRPLGRSIAVSTAAGYVGTVRAWHERKFGSKIGAGLELTRLRDMLKGMRREIDQPPRRRRYGVRTQQLAAAMDMLLKPESCRGTERLDAINLRAALSTAFCVLLRAAEMALQPGEKWDGAKHLCRDDLSFFYDSEGVLCAALMMRPCKSGKHLRGKTVRLVLRSGGTLLDPVNELWRLVHDDPVPESERSSTPLFRLRVNGRPTCLSVADVRTTVKALMQAVGEDPAFFGAHSLRIGGASAALAAGVEPSVLRICGRWNSDIFEIYARLSREAASRVTSLIGSTAFSDLERGFHSEELEMLPEELAVGGAYFDADELGGEDEA